MCTTTKFDLGQPIIDNDKPGGTAIFPELLGYPLILLKPIGYSEDCSVFTRVDYFYFSKTNQKFAPFFSLNKHDDDIAYIENKGKQIPFIVRVERGTINRFMYSIAMLAPYSESLNSPKTLNNAAWNNKLMYKFQGGVGIGRYQGGFSLNKNHALHYASLKRGYAIAYSSGTRTSTHYNLKLAEETAVMVKRHFIAVYGEPIYTVGIGASGGAVQQYVIGQNNRDVIDAAIPQASFSDMITQTINVGDCELLERFFDSEFQKDPSSYWSDWLNRITVQGVNASQTALIEKWSRSPAPKPGASECVNGWRGTVPAVFNPKWTHSAYAKVMKLFKFPKNVVNNIKWTHWDDLHDVYQGPDKTGVTTNSWDNVGVQYGLVALRNGEITKQMFLDLNACVGGWKHPAQMRKGDYPWDKSASTGQFDAWDQANMNLSLNCKKGNPAPRTEGDISIMNTSYDSGHVFRGDINIPIIDVRWYLEPVLDMHHSRASFESRARIQANKGHSDNHLIWFAECSDLDLVTLDWHCGYDPTGDALDVIDLWMQNRDKHKDRDIVQNKPASAVDRCIGAEGEIIYAGDDAWNGILDGKRPGPCSEKFKVFSSSRMQAGAGIKGDIFKCALIPVQQFDEIEGYNTLFDPTEMERLDAIFPTGVCDFGQPDVGLPSQKIVGR
ncbi:MAG: hypothetical protein JKY67_20700 [Pseudomonadales bacterium]|nr:hypothetical protein [Pseudomonadales bacterium]